MTQDEMKGFGEHTSRYFKKTIKNGKKSFNIQNARILDYSSAHPAEVWVKYGAEDEEWSKFEIMKKSTRELTLPSSSKHSGMLPLKPAKVTDVKFLVESYVPQEFRSFYDSIFGSEDVSSETEESECD